MEQAVIKGEYADYRRVKGRKVLQLIIEVPLEEAPRVHAALGEPNPGESTWVAVALLNGRVANKETIDHTAKHKLSQQAGILCNDATFQAYLRETCNEECNDTSSAAMLVRHICCVDSRSEFDTDQSAATAWRTLKSNFEAWKLDGVRGGWL